MRGVMSHAIIAFPGGYTNQVVYVEHLHALCGLGASVTEVSHIGIMYMQLTPNALDNQAQVSFPC